MGGRFLRGWVSVCLAGLCLLGSAGCGQDDSATAGAGGAPAGITGGAGNSVGGTECGTGCAGSSAGGTGGVAGSGGLASSGGMREPVPSAGISTVAEFCDVYPTAWATYQARCLGGTVADWEASTAVHCGRAVRSEAAGRMALDVAQADLCLFSLADSECRGIICRQVLEGAVPDGGTCNKLGMGELGDECEDGFYCPGSGDGCTSTCSPALTEGDSCGGNYNNSPCSWPLQCDWDAQCILPAGEGETCRGRGDCQSGLFCDHEDERHPEVGGFCRRVKSAGPCESWTQCATGFQCLGEGGNKTCIPPKRVGEPCTLGLGLCPQQCSPQGVCEVASGEGGPCGREENSTLDEWETLHCEVGLYCDLETSTCRPQVELGGSCAGIHAQGDPCLARAGSFVECRMGTCQSCEWVED